MVNISIGDLKNRGILKSVPNTYLVIKRRRAFNIRLVPNNFGVRRFRVGCNQLINFPILFFK